jgi:hypothetical protein
MIYIDGISEEYSGDFDDYKGSMDLSLGAFYEGESWEGAANGGSQLTLL